MVSQSQRNADATFRLSISTADESSMDGPWVAQVPLGVLVGCQLHSEDEEVAGR